MIIFLCADLPYIDVFLCWLVFMFFAHFSIWLVALLLNYNNNSLPVLGYRSL